jgi:hypothetical protein
MTRYTRKPQKAIASCWCGWRSIFFDYPSGRVARYFSPATRAKIGLASHQLKQHGERKEGCS